MSSVSWEWNHYSISWVNEASADRPIFIPAPSPWELWLPPVTWFTWSPNTERYWGLRNVPLGARWSWGERLLTCVCGGSLVRCWGVGSVFFTRLGVRRGSRENSKPMTLTNSGYWYHRGRRHHGSIPVVKGPFMLSRNSRFMVIACPVILVNIIHTRNGEACSRPLWI